MCLEAAAGPHSGLPGRLQELCRAVQTRPLARRRIRCSPAGLFRCPAALVAAVLPARSSAQEVAPAVQSVDLPAVLAAQSSQQAAVLTGHSAGEDFDLAVGLPHKMLLHVALEADNYCMTAEQIAAEHRHFAAAVGLERTLLETRHCVAVR